MNRRRLLVLLAVSLLLPASAYAKSPLQGFHSPSRNIKCLFVPGPPSNMLCSIQQAAYSTQLQDNCMAGPGLDWHGFTLTGRGKGQPVCTGGILYDSSRPLHYVNLPYGHTWRHGVYTCTSRTTGVTCRNKTGHG